MRALIYNSILRLMLEEIEDNLNRPVRVMPLSDREARYVSCGVQHLRDGWIFKVRPGERPSDEVLCHELIHICLNIEGWPEFYIHPEWAAEPVREYMGLLAGNLFQHIEIWRRCEELGLPQTQKWNDEIYDMIIPQVANGYLAEGVDPALRGRVQALCLAQAFLSPASSMAKNALRIECLLAGLVQPKESAESMAAVLKTFAPTFPRGCKAVLPTVLSLAGMPANSLGLARINRGREPRPDFWRKNIVEGVTNMVMGAARFAVPAGVESAAGRW